MNNILVIIIIIIIVIVIVLFSFFLFRNRKKEKNIKELSLKINSINEYISNNKIDIGGKHKYSIILYKLR